MKAVLKNELTKLLHRKKYIVLLIIAVLICTSRVGIDFIIAKLNRGIVPKAEIAMEIFPFFAEIYVPLVMFMAICDLIPTEINDLTIKATLMRPVSRFKIISAKITASFLTGAIFYAVIFLACTVLQFVFSTANGMYVLKSFAAYAVDLVPLFVLTLFAAVISMLGKTPTLSMFMIIVAYALMKYCNYFSPVLNNMLFTSYMQWHKLLIGVTIPFAALSVKLGVLLGSAMLLYTAAFALFDRKEY